jgi:hypothetical protein
MVSSLSSSPLSLPLLSLPLLPSQDTELSISDMPMLNYSHGYEIFWLMVIVFASFLGWGFYNAGWLA